MGDGYRLQGGFVVGGWLDSQCCSLVSPFWLVWGRESKVLICLLHFSVGGELRGITGGVPGGYYHRAKQNESRYKKAENSKLAFGSVISIKKFHL